MMQCDNIRLSPPTRLELDWPAVEKCCGLFFALSQTLLAGREYLEIESFVRELSKSIWFLPALWKLCGHFLVWNLHLANSHIHGNEAVTPIFMIMRL